MTNGRWGLDSQGEMGNERREGGPERREGSNCRKWEYVQ